MGIRIDALPSTLLPSRNHELSVMKDGLTMKLTVGQILDLLIDGAPATLDTLNEIAAALADDANLAATLTSAIALKADEVDTDTPILTDKTTPVDADSLRIWDVAGSAFKKLTFANLKAWVRSFLPASTAEQVAATSNTVFVTPGNQRSHPSAAKAYASVSQIAGTYTLQTGGSYNVSAISKQSTGVVRVVWGNAFSSGFYAVSATIQEGGYYGAVITATTTTYVDITIKRLDTGVNAEAGFSIIVFGVLA